ncbi:MAG: ankyrin repeat domain-containing protein [Planctomycetes bacterium]|nr:ankyrin repeat domain-containing protein [Planctomycetota bacterium]
MFDLVRADDGPGLQKHLAAHPGDRDARNESEEQPLHVAAHRDRRACLDVLLGLGADPNATTYNRFTPLHLAASSGHLEVCKALHRAGARLDPPSVAGTPLQMAAANRARAVAMWLQNVGAPLDLESAVYLDDIAWVEKLVGADRELAVAPRLLERAAAQGKTRILELLLEQPRAHDPWAGIHGPSPDLTWFAAAHADTLAMLFRRGADPALRFHGDRIQPGTTLLHVAAKAGATAACVLLLDKGLSPDVADDGGTTPMTLAAEDGREDVVALLIARGAVAHRTARGRGSPLHRALIAVDSGYRAEDRAAHVRVVERLLADGTPMDMTAAVILDRPDAVRALLLADPKACGGGAPAVDLLGRAARMGHLEIATLLLDAGVPVNGKGYSDYTPLHWAAFWNRVDAIDLLRARSAELDPRTDFQATPLHEAVRCNALEAARRLLELGADRTAKNRDGRTPEQLAADTPRPAEFARLFAPAK